MTTTPTHRITAMFVGGPLDGRTQDVPSCRHLTDDAEPSSPRDGDRVARAIAAGRGASAGYVLDERTDGPTLRFVHASAYCRWADDPTLDEARSVGVRDWDAWPYGANISPTVRRSLVDWATAGGYRLAGPRRECLHWVLGQARRCGQANPGHEGEVYSGTYLWDHPTFWTGSAGRFLLAQPYGHVDRDAYDEVRQTWPVEVELTETSPWYGSGTFGVIVRPSATLTP